MKKILSMILALAMVLSLSVTAFAAETITTNGNTSQDVTASYTAGETKVVHIYKAVIEWKSTEATYKGQSVKYTWNPDNQAYTAETTAAEDKNATVTVTVKNYSDQAIWATAQYADKADDNITSNVATTSTEMTAQQISSIVTVEDENYNNPIVSETVPSATANLTIEVTAGKENISTDTVIGTVTVTLSTTEPTT